MRIVQQMAERLSEVDGVVGVVLGGSRARGDHHDTSDVDLGVYYEGSIDLDGLGRLARDFGGADAVVTGHGEWGPWVDGGGWLHVGELPVDWIYREVRRVRASVDAAIAGDVERHLQLGHPFGVPVTQYAAELAVGVIQSDPTGVLAQLKQRVAAYPSALRATAVRGLDEADFILTLARKAIPRNDTTYINGCLFQAVTCTAYAIHASAGAWVTNEKGAVAAASALPTAPADFATDAAAVFAGTDAAAAIDAAAALVAATRELSATRP